MEHIAVKERRVGDIIDVGPPATPASVSPIGDRGRGWRHEDVTIRDCFVSLGADEIDEAHRAAAQLRGKPLRNSLAGPALEIPRLRAAMRQVSERLDHGMGVAIVDGFPVDDIECEAAKRLFLALGHLIARPVAQKWDGTMLYDVTDTGQRHGYGVRGSYTNVELCFHTDNAFGAAPPDYVGLLCFHPARAGGVSRFCSMTAVHDHMVALHPQLLARLYRPMLWDRQAEHAPCAPRVARAPMYYLGPDGLRVRANPGLVRTGHDLAGETIDDELDAALTAFQSITEDPAFWVECPIERGQLQYLNNVDVAHYRSAFDDYPDPGRRRHLVRTWHRNHGGPSYDG